MVTEKLKTKTLIIFSAPGFVSGIMFGPGLGIITAIYAKHFGLNLSFLATALLIGRLFDAITDPLIGYWSDKTKTRIGSRKPWMIVGYGLACFAMYFFFIPYKGVGGFYFIFWYLFITLAWTMAEIPYQAWQAEITHDYEERSKVATFRVLAERLGRTTFAVIPLLPIFATSEMTPEVLKIVAYTVFVLLPIAVIVAVLWAPLGKPMATEKTEPLTKFIRTLPQNRPFMILLGAMLFFGVTDGFFSATLFLFIDSFLQVGDKISFILIAMSIASIISLPFWLKIMNKIGKHQTWAWGGVSTGIVVGSVFFINPGPLAFPLIITVTGLILFLYSAGQVAQPAVLADVIDYDMLKTGQNRGGQFYALMTLIFKGNYAVGSAVALYTLDIFGFDPAQKTHDAMATFGIKFAFGGLPLICVGIAVGFLFFFPITKKRHEIIRRKLERRKAAEKSGEK